MFADKLPPGWWQFAKFLVVGGLNTLFSTGVYWIGLWAGLPFYGATALALLAGIAVGFKAHSHWVFSAPGHAVWYFVCALSVYGVNTLAVWAVRGTVGDFWAPVVMLPLTTVTTYFLFKYLVFKDKAP
jgi:putative flippase GtrA